MTAKPVLLGLLLLGTVCSFCSARTWTSTTGKTLEGDLVRVQSGKAYIRVGKRVGAVPIKGLSRSDQAFIKKWITDQQLARLSSKLEGLAPSGGGERPAAPEAAPLTPINAALTDAEHERSLDSLKQTVEEIQGRQGGAEDDGIQEAINDLNTFRFLCGLDYQVGLDGTYNTKATAAASICNALGRLSHAPENPGWEKGRYQVAREGAGHCNLQGGGSVGRSVHSYMDDSDAGNITVLGHRRWCLNPAMGKTGFGSDGRYSAMWSMDDSNRKGSKLPFVAFPAPGFMPTDYFEEHYAWSVSLQKDAYKYPDSLAAENVKVYQLGGNETRPRAGEQPLKLSFFNLNRDGYGIPCCIIFKPEGVEVEHRSRYWVVIDGIEKRNGINTRIEYLVDFIRI